MFDLNTSRQHCDTELEKLLDRCLPGGYEEHLVENRSGEEDVSTTFAGIELRGKLHRPQRRRHLFVTTRDRDVNAIKVEIIQSLTNFLQSRLSVEKASGTREACYADMLKALSPIRLSMLVVPMTKTFTKLMQSWLRTKIAKNSLQAMVN